MLKLARYYWTRARSPGRADFLDMGYGIEARYRRCREQWAAHLRLSREFSVQSFSALPAGGALAILGAGRLLDVDAAALLSRFDALHLFDADPGVLPAWRALRRRYGARRVQFHLGDLTAALDDWSAVLRAALGRRTDEDAAAAVLAGLPPCAAIPLDGFAAILSLNVLSQIPVYWRDRVIDRLQASGTPISSSGEYGPALQAALTASLRRLQEEAIGVLRRSRARRVVLLTDTDFFYYRPESSPWQQERALYLDPIAALAPIYTVSRSDSWLWHIAPAGVEQPDWGAIHRVGAWDLASAGAGDAALG